MATVKLIQQKFYDEFTGQSGGGVDFLFGCVGSKITAVTDFYVYVASENIHIITDAGLSKITRVSTGSFITDGFQVGDTFDLSGAGANDGAYEIGEVTDSYIMTTGAVALSLSSTFLTASLYGTSAVTFGTAFVSQIENSAPDNFFDLVDSETQPKYIASGLDTDVTGTTTCTIATNSHGWEYEATNFGAGFAGLTSDGYKQRFRFRHNFILKPIALYSQVQNLENGNPPAPDYYQDRLCLRYIVDIQMRRSRLEADTPHRLTISRAGNTGWVDEFLNGEPATYSLISVTGAPKYCGNTDMQIEIESADAIFTAATKIVLTMHYIPQTGYINTATDFGYNFAFDRVLQTAGSASADGLVFGTDYGQIENCVVTYLTPTRLQINFTHSPAAALQTRLSDAGDGNRKFVIAVTVQDPAVTDTADTDVNTIKILVDDYACDLDDATLWDVDPKVTFYGLTDDAVFGDAANLVEGDTVRAVVPFKIKNSVSAIQQNITADIRAVNTGDDSYFLLESHVIDTSGFCLKGGVQEIEIEVAKNYRLPNDENNNVTITRDSANDGGGYAAYILTYPFKARWESWVSVDDPACDFEGVGQQWSEYTSNPDYQLQFVVSANVEDTTGHVTPFEHTSLINVFAPDASGTVVASVVINTYDESVTYTLSHDDFAPILYDENTLVEAVFTGSFGSPPTGTTGVYGVFELDIQVIGGIRTTWVFSSNYETRDGQPENPWLGEVNDEDLPTLTAASPTTYALTARLDYTKLQKYLLNGATNYRIRARLEYLY